MMLIVAVGLTLGLVAPVVQAMLWRVPFGQISIVMAARRVTSTVMVTVLVGGIALVLLTLFPAPATAGAQASIAAGIGGAAAFFRLLTSSSRRRRMRGAFLLAHRLRDSDARGQALAALERTLDEARPRGTDGDFSTYASMVLLVVTPLTAAGLWKEAERRLAEIPASALGVEQRAVRAQALAACRVHLGDIPGARDALGSVTRPVHDAAVEQWMQATEALLLAVEGRADDALGILGDETPLDPSMRASMRLVRAHAYASRGARDEACSELEALKREAGTDGLASALAPEGPATPIARELMAQKAEGDGDG